MKKANLMSGTFVSHSKLTPKAKLPKEPDSLRKNKADDERNTTHNKA